MPYEAPPVPYRAPTKRMLADPYKPHIHEHPSHHGMTALNMLPCASKPRGSATASTVRALKLPLSKEALRLYGATFTRPTHLKLSRLKVPQWRQQSKPRPLSSAVQRPAPEPSPRASPQSPPLNSTSYMPQQLAQCSSSTELREQSSQT